MLTHVASLLKHLAVRFRRHTGGSIAPTAALVLIPIMTAAGAAVDYSRANNFRSGMQAALDAGLLAGARDGSDSWKQAALDMFNANLAAQGKAGSAATPSFIQESAAVYKGVASGSVPTSLLGIINVKSIAVAARATAKASEADNSCILTLDHGQPLSHVSLSLNGAPIINLSGCSIRSNTSLDCQGHDGNVTKGIAAGSAVDCGKPKSNALPVPDVYKSLASNIVPQCGGYRSSVGVPWTPGGTFPPGPAVKTVSIGGRTEYHICGDLELSGSGTFDPGADTLIVIENGSLNIADKADATIKRTAVVLTGNNSYPSSINFPNGNGKSASLTISPPLDPSDPWQGVALFQDPALTNNVDNKWGPGASFSADGLVYLGNSNVVTDGNTSSSNAKCSKFVMNSFVTNGSVNLDFNQTVASCAAIGLKQWGGIIVHLVK
jgi:Flp pilus assembly protein TadG